MYKEQFEIVTSTSEINRYMISINEAMMSLLNKCDIDYKSLQDTVLAELLGKFPQSFNIVISYDNMDFIVSFYCKRKNEEWLIDDLDSYTEEAIMVMTI